MPATNEAKSEDGKIKITAYIPISTNTRLDIYKATRRGEYKQDIIAEAVEYFLDEMEVKKA